MKFTVFVPSVGKTAIEKTRGINWAALFLLASGVSAWAQPQYTISTLAGGVAPTTPASATSISPGSPIGVAVDGSGNFYFSTQLHCVFKASGGTLTRVAGTCRPGLSGDGSSAASAQLNGPSGVAVDTSGNLYIADHNNNRIRKVSAGGTITTFAGTGTPGYSGDNAQAANAQLDGPTGLAVDPAGNLYIADTVNNVIRKVSTGGVITTIAGSGAAGFSGDGNLATSAQLNTPSGVAVDSSGNVYVADQGNQRVRKISGGNITTVAGNGTQGYSGDGSSATSASLSGPTAVAVDSSNNLYIADLFGNRVRVVAGGIINTVTGNGVAGFSGDGGSASGAMINSPSGLAVDSTSKLYIADNGNSRVRQISGGTINTVDGNGTAGFSGDGAAAAGAQLALDSSVAMDASGNLYVADTANNRIRKITPGGTISTIGGTGVAGFSGDGGQANLAQLSTPSGVAVDSSGDVFIADTGNHRIREITSSGVISTIAGTGTPGYSGDAGTATSAQLNNPLAVAVDSSGNVFIADTVNNRIREVTNHVIRTIAGNGTPGYTIEGTATSAELNYPDGIAVDASGNVFIADRFNNRIRKVTGGVISTVAGTGSGGFSGDGAQAANAQLNLPSAVAVDSSGNLYIADTNNNRIRYISSGGIINTIAGTGVAGFSADGISATTAQLDGPTGIAVDSSGNVYVAEAVANDVRRLISSTAPTVNANPTSLTFTSALKGASQGQNIGLTLSSPVAGVTYTTSSAGGSWLNVVPGSGGFPATLTVTVNPAGLSIGTYNGSVIVSTPSAANSQLTIPVTLTVSSCSYLVNSSSPAVAPAGGSGVIQVTTSTGCAWSANSNTSWLSITSGSSGNGSATFGFSAASNTTGAQRSGSFTVAGQTVTVTQGANNAQQIPALVSLNPFQGAGPSATLTLVYSHPSGWAAIQSAEFIVNPRWEPSNRAGGCYIKYAPGTGLFTLIADDGSSVAGTATPGSAKSISNSQCTLNAASSSATGSGTTLTVVASLTFQASFSGQRHIWMQASDYNNLSTNWLVYGVWFPTETSVSAIPWYRIYDPNSKSYLYSADPNEYNTLGQEGFVQQGTSGLVMNGPTSVGGISNIAWYRVYVNATSSHFWTSDRNEFLTLVNQQQAYVGEGVAAFVMPYINAQGNVSPQVTNTIPFYRAAFQGANLHFWTADPNEYFNTGGEHLPAGYVGEGIACYIFPASGAQFSSSDAVAGPAVAAAVEDDGSPTVVSIANGATYAGNGVIAPGQALTIYGRHLGSRVLINGVPAEVVSARENELRVVIPSDLGGASEVSLEVEREGRRSKAVKLTAVDANPAIFVGNAYGRGNAQAQNEDGTLNAPEQGAARGSVVTLYTTGYRTGSLPIEVHIGGRPAEMVSAQLSATRPGVVEVRVRIPFTVEPGTFQPVVLHVGNQFSQPGVGLAIR